MPRGSAKKKSAATKAPTEARSKKAARAAERADDEVLRFFEAEARRETEALERAKRDAEEAAKQARLERLKARAEELRSVRREDRPVAELADPQLPSAHAQAPSYLRSALDRVAGAQDTILAVAAVPSSDGGRDGDGDRDGEADEADEEDEAAEIEAQAAADVDAEDESELLPESHKASKKLSEELQRQAHSIMMQTLLRWRRNGCRGPQPSTAPEKYLNQARAALRRKQRARGLAQSRDGAEGSLGLGDATELMDADIAANPVLLASHVDQYVQFAANELRARGFFAGPLAEVDWGVLFRFDVATDPILCHVDAVGASARLEVFLFAHAGNVFSFDTNAFDGFVGALERKALDPIVSPDNWVCSMHDDVPMLATGFRVHFTEEQRRTLPCATAAAFGVTGCPCAAVLNGDAWPSTEFGLTPESVLRTFGYLDGRGGGGSGGGGGGLGRTAVSSKAAKSKAKSKSKAAGPHGSSSASTSSASSSSATTGALSFADMGAF